MEEKRHFAKPHPHLRPRAPRPGALHPLRPLHPLRRRGGRRPADPASSSGAARCRCSPSPTSRSPPTSRGTPSRSARWARCWPRPTGSGPGRGTSRRWRRPARCARSDCRVALQSSADRLVRSLGRRLRAGQPRLAVRQGPVRLRLRAPRRTGSIEPQVRAASDGQRDRGRPGPRRSTPPPPACAGALDRGGPASVAVIGGARGTNEDAYAWARFAKGVLQTDNVDCQVGDGLPAEVVDGLPRARSSDCDTRPGHRAPGPDLKEELPVAYLRVKRAAVDLKVPADRALGRRAPASPATPRSRLRHRPRARPTTGRPAAWSAAVADRDASHRRRPTSTRRRRPSDAAARAAGERPAPGESSSSSAGRRWPSRPTPRVAGRAAALRRGLPGVPLPVRAAARQRARRARPRPGARVPARAGHARRRPGLVRGRLGRRPRRRGARHRRASSRPPPTAASRRWSCSAPTRCPTSPTATWPAGPWPRRRSSWPSTPSPRRAPTPAHVFLPVALAGEKRGTTTNLEGRLLRLARKVTPARHRHGGLAGRRRAGPAPRRRLRPGGGRRGHRRDRPARPRPPRAPTPPCSAGRSTAS